MISVFCSLALTPIIFQLTQSTAISNESRLLVSSILAMTLFLPLLYLIQNFLIKQSCPTIETRSILRDYKPLRNIFSVFYKDENNNSTVLNEKPSPTKKRIDPKYFKPKYIYHELMSIWGTTYTVITWGSVWIIGGTFVATERLANKIKTKCTRERDLLGANRGTGRNSSFASFNSSFSSSHSVDSTGSGKNSFKKISSWTKRSFTAAKKKFNKFIGVGVLQLTQSAQFEPSETNQTR